MNWEAQGVGLLAASLVRPLWLAIAAWLMLRALRVRHPASLHAVWTAVLAGMLLLPVVSVFVPHWKAPVLPAARQPEAAAVPVVGFTTYTEAVEAGHAWPPRDSAGERPAHDSPRAPAYIYLAGLLAIATYRMAGWVLLRRVMARSTRLRTRLRVSGDVLTLWLWESCVQW